MSVLVDTTPGLDIETRLFIGGDFVDSVEGGRIPVTNPHDNTILAEVSEARPADVDRAVEAARKAFPAWSRMGAAERGRLMRFSAKHRVKKDCHRSGTSSKCSLNDLKLPDRIARRQSPAGTVTKGKAPVNVPNSQIVSVCSSGAVESHGMELRCIFL